MCIFNFLLTKLKAWIALPLTRINYYNLVLIGSKKWEHSCYLGTMNLCYDVMGVAKSHYCTYAMQYITTQASYMYMHVRFLE